MTIAFVITCKLFVKFESCGKTAVFESLKRRLFIFEMNQQYYIAVAYLICSVYRPAFFFAFARVILELASTI